jgi:hypothetical protein
MESAPLLGCGISGSPIAAPRNHVAEWLFHQEKDTCEKLIGTYLLENRSSGLNLYPQPAGQGGSMHLSDCQEEFPVTARTGCGLLLHNIERYEDSI